MTKISYTANFEYTSISQSNLVLDSSGELIITFNIPSTTQQDLLSVVVHVSIDNFVSESSVHSRAIN